MRSLRRGWWGETPWDGLRKKPWEEPGSEENLILTSSSRWADSMLLCVNDETHPASQSSGLLWLAISDSTHSLFSISSVKNFGTSSVPLLGSCTWLFTSCLQFACCSELISSFWSFPVSCLWPFSSHVWFWVQISCVYLRKMWDLRKLGYTSSSMTSCTSCLACWKSSVSSGEWLTRCWMKLFVAGLRVLATVPAVTMYFL